MFFSQLFGTGAEMENFGPGIDTVDIEYSSYTKLFCDWIFEL